MKYAFILLLTFLTNVSHGKAYNLQQNEVSKYVKGKSIADYYPLDSITSFKLSNWKGTHFLNKEKIKAISKCLKTFVFDGRYAYFKPGHLLFDIHFKNGSNLYFYGSSDMVIIEGNGNDNFTFITKKPVNFEAF